MATFGAVGEFHEKNEQWSTYIDRFEEFFIANNINSAPQKRAILNSTVGSVTFKLIGSLLHPKKPKEATYDEIVKLLSDHYRPTTSITFARFEFGSRNRHPGESVNDYLAALRSLASDCNFGESLDTELCHRLTLGLNDSRIQKNLLAQGDKLDLKKALEVANSMEYAESQSRNLSHAAGTTTPRVDAVQYRPSSNQMTRGPSTTPLRGRTLQRGRGRGRQNFSRSQSAARPCRNCGNPHAPRSCPAFGKQCRKCGKLNHFARYCLSSRRSVNELAPNSAPTFECETEYEYENQGNSPSTSNNVSPQFQIEEVTDLKTDKDELYATLAVKNKNIMVKLDTGARCNVLPKKLYLKVGQLSSIDTSRKSQLTAYGGSKVETMGVAWLKCRGGPNNVSHDFSFHIVDDHTKVSPILGLHACILMGLIDVSPVVHGVHEINSVTSAILAEYADLFDESLGKLPVQYKMTINNDVTPVIRPTRRIPAAMEAKVKAELDRMTKLGVIVPTSTPTEWISSMVATHKKDGSIRLCIDPQDLNRALKRPHHPTKTVEEVASRMTGATVFSVLDARSSFWQIPLDHESSLLTTFGTPYGRYRFLRMPYGICSASDVYQKAMEHLFADLPCSIIVDDIIIGGRDKDEHDRNLRKVLDRAREVNLKLNPRKCKFQVDEVPYVGHVFTQHGLQPDANKVKAINEMPPPDSPTALQRFLGMVTYLSKFIENLSEVAAPLRDLIRKDVQWQWLEHHQAAFDRLKHMISNPPMLRYYDVNDTVTLTCDASKFGLGAACLQQDEPIAYASRTMTLTEQRYAQIEKELLAIVFACTKFYHYIYGKHTVVETDHKPLITIMQKPIHMIPARLQSMRMKLQKFNITLKYKKGVDLHIADTLSRAPCSQVDQSEAESDRFDVMVIKPISASRLTELQTATESDPLLQRLNHTIMNGWPERLAQVSPELKHYFSFREELTVDDGLIMKGSKVVIPESLHTTYARLLHNGHPGAEATKRRARDIVYWTTMNIDIDNLVSSCTVCNSTKPHQQKEPMKSHPIPDLPWQIVGVDLFEWNGLHYMAIADSYSGWFDMAQLKDQSSYTVIQKLKRQFSIHGIPATVVTDNARQFTSHEFTDFAKQWDFEHKTSSPHYPQSNGLAESAVKRAKMLLEKTKRDNSDLHLNLLNIRNVPADSTLGSAAQRLMTRRLRTPVPTAPSLLQPSVKTHVTPRLEQKRHQQKAAYDKTAMPLKPLNPGQVVRLQTPKGHDLLGVVVSSSGDPRSYLVNVNGTVYRRNRRHLLPVSEPTPVCAPDDYLQQAHPPPPQRQVPHPPAQPVIQPQPPICTPVVTRSGRVSRPNPKYSDFVQ